MHSACPPGSNFRFWDLNEIARAAKGFLFFSPSPALMTRFSTCCSGNPSQGVKAEGKKQAGRAPQVGSTGPDEFGFQPFQGVAAERGCHRSVRGICLWCAGARGG